MVGTYEQRSGVRKGNGMVYKRIGLQLFSLFYLYVLPFDKEKGWCGKASLGPKVSVNLFEVSIDELLWN